MSEPTVITIGNFDGVHRGHQALLRRARHLAHARGCRVVALTFDPHPIRTLRPGHEPAKLSRLHERIAYLRAAGADRVEAFKPSRDILDLPPEPFLKIILDTYSPIAVVEGEDFHFGRNREGDMHVLAQLGRRMGFTAVVEPKVAVSLSDRTIAPVSSTLVRWLVSQGRVVDASLALGRPFELHGEIVLGDRVGRTLGVPTANLSNLDIEGHVIPSHGVYAGFADIEGGIADFGRRARDGKLGMDEMTGGTFTISNGGVFGSLNSMPILNVPQSAILGMHSIQKRPMVVGDEIEIRPMMHLALSYDHRIVDGREAVSFLVRIKQCIEDPQRILLNV